MIYNYRTHTHTLRLNTQEIGCKSTTTGPTTDWRHNRLATTDRVLWSFFSKKIFKIVTFKWTLNSVYNSSKWPHPKFSNNIFSIKFQFLHLSVTEKPFIHTTQCIIWKKNFEKFKNYGNYCDFCVNIYKSVWHTLQQQQQHGE